MPWKIRQYVPGDEEGIYNLFNVVCKLGGAPQVTADKNRFMARWKWEHLQNPAGNLVVVADLNGRIIGHLAEIPVQMKVGGTVVRGSITSEVMTHPDFRLRGIFTEMYKLSLNERINQGFSLSYAFNNENSHAAFLKFGSVDVGKMRVLTKYLKCDDAMKRLLRNSPLCKVASPPVNVLLKAMYPTRQSITNEKLEVKELDFFDEKFDSLWDTASETHNIAVVREQPYLNWRYSRHPDLTFSILGAISDGQLLGYVILTSLSKKPNSRVGYIVDIFTDLRHHETAPLLVSKAVKKFQEENMSEVKCWMLTGDPYNAVLKQQGFIHPTRCLPLTSIVLQPNMNQTLIKHEKNWHITLGDMDGMFPITS